MPIPPKVIPAGQFLEFAPDALRSREWWVLAGGERAHGAAIAKVGDRLRRRGRPP